MFEIIIHILHAIFHMWQDLSSQDLLFLKDFFWCKLVEDHRYMKLVSAPQFVSLQFEKEKYIKVFYEI